MLGVLSGIMVDVNLDKHDGMMSQSRDTETFTKTPDCYRCEDKSLSFLTIPTYIIICPLNISQNIACKVMVWSKLLLDNQKTQSSRKS